MERRLRPPSDARDWLNPELVDRAAQRPRLAAFLARIDDTLGDAFERLDVLAATPVLTGAGGMTVRIVTPDGAAALKIPIDAPQAAVEAAGTARLHAAGLGPELIAAGDGWLALRWVPAPAVGEMFRRAPLDPRRSADVCAALAELPVDGLDCQIPYLQRRTTFDDFRRTRIAQLGIDADRVADTVTATFASLLDDRSTWGFCHGDLHCGNLLDTPRRWTLIDSVVAHGPRAHDVALLGFMSWCGRPPHQWLRTVCRAADVTADEVERWTFCIAAFLFPALAHSSAQRCELDGALGVITDHLGR